MLTMKQYLAPIAILAAACHAQSPPAGQSSSDRQASAQKPLSAPTVSPRQLSDQERAELRRQLYQYSRVAGKGS
jgi:hypothetical protein